MSKSKNIKLSEESYLLLKSCAKKDGVRIGQALEMAVKQYLGENDVQSSGDLSVEQQLSDLQGQVRQLIEKAGLMHDKTINKSSMKNRKNSKKDKMATKALASRRSRANERLVFLFQIYASKPSVGLSKEGARAWAEDIWKDSKEYNCISWGSLDKHMQEGLDEANGIDRRQRSDFLDLRDSDIVVATWGKYVLGWGFVSRHPQYLNWPTYEFDAEEYLDLREEYEENSWFRHTVKINWMAEWPMDEMVLTKDFPMQPTMRRPALDNNKAWEKLSDIGIPVDGRGIVTSTLELFQQDNKAY